MKKQGNNYSISGIPLQPGHVVNDFEMLLRKQIQDFCSANTVEYQALEKYGKLTINGNNHFIKPGPIDYLTMLSCMGGGTISLCIPPPPGLDAQNIPVDFDAIEANPMQSQTISMALQSASEVNEVDLGSGFALDSFVDDFNF